MISNKIRLQRQNTALQKPLNMFNREKKMKEVHLERKIYVGGMKKYFELMVRGVDGHLLNKMKEAEI